MLLSVSQPHFFFLQNESNRRIKKILIFFFSLSLKRYVFYDTEKPYYNFTQLQWEVLAWMETVIFLPFLWPCGAGILGEVLVEQSVQFCVVAGSSWAASPLCLTESTLPGQPYLLHSLLNQELRNIELLFVHSFHGHIRRVCRPSRTWGWNILLSFSGISSLFQQAEHLCICMHWGHDLFIFSCMRRATFTCEIR